MPMSESQKEFFENGPSGGVTCFSEDECSEQHEAWLKMMPLVRHEFVPPFGPDVFDHEQYDPAWHLFLTCEYLRWKLLKKMPFETRVILRGLRGHE